MNSETIIRRLARFGRALPVMVEGLTDDEVRWKPPSGAWSILEVVCHLGDEEVDDFRARLFSTLRDPGAEWAPIHPTNWALERRYNEQPFAPAVARFVSERQQSIAMLRGLQNPDWSNTHPHSEFGSIAAGDLLASWAAHDALHLRQIAKRLHELAGRDAPGFSTRYAGDWGP